MQASDGNFYGMTINGGAYSAGTVYSITPGGVFTSIHSFTGTDGQFPTCTLLPASDGLYGTAAEGGANSSGTVFRVNMPGSVSFAPAAYPVSENSGSVVLTVVRTGGGSGTVTADYSCSDGTAVHNVDYTAVNGTLTWANGDSAPKTITVPLLNPQVYDGSTRAFTVALSAITGGAYLRTPGTAIVNITENDTPPAQPAVSLTSPLDNATVFTGSSLTLAASVDDPDGVLTSVQFAINGAAVGTANPPGPLVATVTAPATDGVYTVTATAFDTLGRSSTSTHTLNVRTQGATGDPAPDIAILTDLNNRQVGEGQTISVTITASTSNGDPLKEVDLYADDVLVVRLDASGNPITSGTGHGPVRADAPAPLAGNVIFQTNYQVPGTTKLVNLLAVALTQAGVAKTSPAVTIRPVDPAVDRPPVIALNGIVDGATVLVGVPLSLPVSVSDPDAANAQAGALARQDSGIGVIADLAFYLNAALAQHGIGNDPNQRAFTFTPPAAGDYVINAIATDGAGLSGVAQPIRVHAVTMTPPTVPTVNVAASGDGRAQFGVENGKVVFRRTGADTSAALVVRYKVKGSAKAGVDFKTLPGTATIPAGADAVKIKFKPLLNPANPGKLKAKVQLLPSTDGSYQSGSATLATVNVVGGS